MIDLTNLGQYLSFHQNGMLYNHTQHQVLPTVADPLLRISVDILTSPITVKPEGRKPLAKGSRQILSSELLDESVDEQ